MRLMSNYEPFYYDFNYDTPSYSFDYNKLISGNARTGYRLAESGILLSVL